MRTKENILDRQVDIGCQSHQRTGQARYGIFDCAIIYNAMDEYAKECVKEFPIWMQDNEWVKSQSRPMYYCAKDGVELEYITFDQLFEKFIQSIKP